MYHSWKHGSHLKYSVTVKNMGHTQKEVSLLEKWVTLQTMCHSCKNKSHLKNVAYLNNWVLVLISMLFYSFSSLRRGDQSNVICIV